MSVANLAAFWIRSLFLNLETASFLMILSTSWRVLLYEFVDVHVTTSHSDKDLVILTYLDVYLLGTKLIDTLGLSQEQNLHLLLLRERVDCITQEHVDPITLPTNIDFLIVLHLLHQLS